MVTVMSVPMWTPPGAQEEKLGRAAQLADEVHDDRDEGLDDLAECRGEDDGDREVDDVASHDEFLETLEHEGDPFLCVPRRGL